MGPNFTCWMENPYHSWEGQFKLNFTGKVVLVFGNYLSKIFTYIGQQYATRGISSSLNMLAAQKSRIL